MTLHAPRPSFISIRAAQRETWDQIAAFVGHLDQRTTRRYVHVMPRDKRETANSIPFEFSMLRTWGDTALDSRGSPRAIRSDLGTHPALRCAAAFGAAWLTLVTEPRVGDSSGGQMLMLRRNGTKSLFLRCRGQDWHVGVPKPV